VSIAPGVMPSRPAVSRSNREKRLQALVLEIARHVDELRQLREAIDQAVHRYGEFVGIRILDGELVLVAADAVLDSEILHRLHVERDSLDARDLRLQAPHDFRDVRHRVRISASG